MNCGSYVRDLSRYERAECARIEGQPIDLVCIRLLAQRRKEIARLARGRERGPRSQIGGTTRLRRRLSGFDVVTGLRAGRSYLQRRNGRVVIIVLGYTIS
jgi:hypothetical protein